MQVWTPGLGKGSLDGPGKAVEAFDRGDKEALDTAIAQIVQHLCPEFGALAGLKSQARDVARSIWQNRQRDEDRLVRDRPVTVDVSTRIASMKTTG